MSKIKDLSGTHFGRLLVLGDSGLRTKHRNVIFNCLCDCGNATQVSGGSLMRGKVKSCGCYREDFAIMIRKDPTTHGKSKSRLYEVWSSMKSRCYNPANTRYEHYGAKGISVCDEWRDNFQSFYDWAIANEYDETAAQTYCTLDRIDYNGDYCPDNCRFVDANVQNNNKPSNIWLTYEGKTLTAAQWARETGLKASVIRYRYHAGWNTEDILTKEVTPK